MDEKWNAQMHEEFDRLSGGEGEPLHQAFQHQIQGDECENLIAEQIVF